MKIEIKIQYITMIYIILFTLFSYVASNCNETVTACMTNYTTINQCINTKSYEKQCNRFNCIYDYNNCMKSSKTVFLYKYKNVFTQKTVFICNDTDNNMFNCINTKKCFDDLIKCNKLTFINTYIFNNSPLGNSLFITDFFVILVIIFNLYKYKTNMISAIILAIVIHVLCNYLLSKSQLNDITIMFVYCGSYIFALIVFYIYYVYIKK